MERKKLLLISAILGSIYLLYLGWSYFALRTGIGHSTAYFGMMEEDGMHSFTLVFALILVFGHTLCVSIGVASNWVAWLNNQHRAALLGGIMYVLSGLIAFLWLPCVLIEAVLCFIGANAMAKESLLKQEHGRRPEG